MNTIYNHFLKDVVEDIYGYHIVPLGQRKDDNDIEKIKLGYNPLYIMELAGHTRLETQMGYYNHVETFATAKTNVLKNMIMNANIDLTKILKDCPKGWKFYTPIWGEVTFNRIRKEYCDICIDTARNNSA